MTPLELHGYLLHSRPYRETSVLAELLTLEQGRLCVVARGVRGAHPRLVLPNFCALLLQTRGRGELKQLQSADIEHYNKLPDDQRLYLGLYLNELAYRLLPREEPCAEVYESYRQALRIITQCQQLIEAEPALRHFERTILNLLGFEYLFSVDCNQGEPLRDNSTYYLNAESGFSPMQNGGGSGWSGALIKQVAMGYFEELEVRRAAKQIFRLLIDGQLQGKPLHSRQLFLNRGQA